MNVRCLALVLVTACGPASQREDAGNNITDATSTGSNSRDAGIIPAIDAGGGGSGNTSPTAGTRIKLRTLTMVTSSADGAYSSSSGFGGWYDSQRNEPCNPALASDGMSRCLPSVSGWSSGYYADASCTVPLAYVSYQAGCTPVPPKYMNVYTPPTTCGGQPVGPQIYTVSTQVATSYYYRNGATCTGPTTNTSTSVAYYAAVTPEVPPTDFEPMTTTMTYTP